MGDVLRLRRLAPSGLGCRYERGNGPGMRTGSCSWCAESATAPPTRQNCEIYHFLLACVVGACLLRRVVTTLPTQSAQHIPRDFDKKL